MPENKNGALQRFLCFVTTDCANSALGVENSKKGGANIPHFFM